MNTENKMTTKTFTTEEGTITFNSKYFIIQGNNGNHTGYNREREINAEGYKTKAEANKVYKEMANENGAKEGDEQLEDVEELEEEIKEAFIKKPKVKSGFPAR